MADEFFTIEVGDSYIRICDSQVNNNQLTISSLAVDDKALNFYTSQNEKTLNETATALENLVQNLKIKKKTVNLIIPDTYTYSQVLTMPYLKEKELLSAIKYQADQFIPLPIDETTLDLDIVYEDKPKNNLLLLIVAAPNKLVERLSALVDKAGLIPQNIENQASSVSRLINYVYKLKPVKQTMVFANVDYFSTTLYFYNPSLNLVTNIYNFKIGLNLFSKEVQVNFNLDQQKADQALKNIGLASGGSMNLADILQPALNEFTGEVEKFILSLKEKEKISGIDQLIVFNLANQITQLEKGLQGKLGINTSQFDISGFIAKNNNFNVFDHSRSSFISILGEALK